MQSETTRKHTFVVCAYQKSPFLEECLRSVLAQTYRSTVVIATGTPNDYITNLAQRYELELYINPNSGSLANDWNFALQCADTELVTLAHQDDVYAPSYSEKILEYYNRSRQPIILFSDYWEIRKGNIVKSNKLLKVKRIMLVPLRIPLFWRSIFVRRRILSFGSAICCPSVTMVRSEIPIPLFENNMKSNIDWQAWEMLSRKKGSFVFVPQALMQHRIHEESTTSELLGKSARKEEDLMVFRKFWPDWIAGLIELAYQKGEKSNSLK